VLEVDNDDDWAAGRKAVYVGLRRAIEELTFPAIARAFDQLCSEWPSGPVDDGLHRFERATGSIIGEVAFGPEAPYVLPFVAKLLGVLQAIANNQDSPSRQAALDSEAKRYERQLREAIRSVTAHRMQSRRNSDLASILTHPELGSLNADQATRMLESVVLAGYGVPALTLAWAIILLDRHPAEYEILRKEAAGCVIDAVDSPLSATHSAILETLRLYPPTWLIGRRLNVEVDLHGRHFQAGHCFYMSSYITSRTQHCFDNPRAFQPSRWYGGKLESQLPRYAYFPFGGGSRICLGNMFARLEIKILLAMLTREHALRVVNPEQVRINSKRGLRPVQLTLARS
jgi:cytochrome P450